MRISVSSVFAFSYRSKKKLSCPSRGLGQNVSRTKNCLDVRTICFHHFFCLSYPFSYCSFFSQRCCIVCCFGNWWLRSICSVYSTHFLFLKDAVCILVAFFVDFISLVDLHQQLIIISLNDDKKRGVCHCHPFKKSIAKLILSHFPQKSHPPNPKIHHKKKNIFPKNPSFFLEQNAGKNMSSPATNRRPLSTGPVDLVQPAVCAFQRSQRTSVDWWIYESDSWI